ncbi:aldo/keto reductase, partial [Enterobacter sp. R-1.5.3]|uniref:aldo/keto reductase n=1 Tax=Enterobacter sp. R-1.5.3 TaxID=3046184 RepID=UPI002B24839C
TEEKLEMVRNLTAIAEERVQKLAQMALAWVLRHENVTSVLIGASKKAQIDDAVGMLENRHFSE